ncbi:MAG TPA: ATP-binding cassette domain-containing protein [Gemmatimonadaceae bacterium]|nr:ATP-binding cassette domain-containing protein [Gemmatimonadaceae bacterium]
MSDAFDDRTGGDRTNGGRTNGDRAADRAAERAADRRHAERRGSAERDASVRNAIRSELAADAPDALLRRAARDEAGGPVIELRHVSLAFEHPILEDVSLAVHDGETVCVLGESGTGKSTMLKLILRLLTPDSGQVCIEGRDICELSFSEALRVRQHMGMVFQGAALFDSMTVFENVAYPLREHTAMSEGEIEARVREKLEFVDLEPDRVMPQLPSELSGGMKKRVGIARATVAHPEIVIYDEPTAGLDPVTTQKIYDLLTADQARTGASVLAVSSDVAALSRFVDEIAFLYRGEILYRGPAATIADAPDPIVRQFVRGELTGPLDDR